MTELRVMIAGPCTGGAGGREANLRASNGVAMALPIIAAAGEGASSEIMMPLSPSPTERCDACLRVGGPSAGADAEVKRFQAAGKPVRRALEELPA